MTDAIVATVSNELKAELIRGLLETEGIPCYLRPAGELSFGYPTDAWIGRDVIVAEADLERAREIIEAAGDDVVLPGT